MTQHAGKALYGPLVTLFELTRTTFPGIAVCAATILLGTFAVSVAKLFITGYPFEIVNWAGSLTIAFGLIFAVFDAGRFVFTKLAAIPRSPGAKKLSTAQPSAEPKPLGIPPPAEAPVTVGGVSVDKVESHLDAMKS